MIGWRRSQASTARQKQRINSTAPSLNQIVAAPTKGKWKKTSKSWNQKRMFQTNLNQDCRKLPSLHRTLRQQRHNAAPESILKHPWLIMVNSKEEGRYLHPEDYRKSCEISEIFNRRTHRQYWPFVEMWHLKSWEYQTTRVLPLAGSKKRQATGGRTPA